MIERRVIDGYPQASAEERYRISSAIMSRSLGLACSVFLWHDAGGSESDWIRRACAHAVEVVS